MAAATGANVAEDGNGPARNERVVEGTATVGDDDGATAPAGESVPVRGDACGGSEDNRRRTGSMGGGEPEVDVEAEVGGDYRGTRGSCAEKE